MTPAFRTTAAALALLLAGCGGAVAPPATPGAPDAWINAPATAAPATEVPATWWRSFDSDELGALVAAARANNPDLAASAQRIAQATARARASGAGLYPAFDATGGSARRWPGEGTASSSFQGGFEASYEADLWGANAAGRDAAEAARRASDFDHAAAAISLSAEVATTYFQYLSLNDRLANARRILDLAERVLALVESQARFGTASGLELAQQRREVATLRAGIPSLEQSRAETLNALGELLGTTAARVQVRAASLESVTLPTIVPGLPSSLLDRRPDLRAAEASLAAAEADVEAARAAMMPAIRLTGSSGYTSAELSSLFSPAGLLTSLAGGLTAPIFDAGRLAAQRDQAQAAAAEAVETYRGAIIAAFRDVEDALAAAAYLSEVEAAQRQALEEAERAYGLAEIRYRAGSTDFLTLLETQRSLFQQQDALAQTRLARLDAAVALYRALGGGWCGEEGCEADA